MKISDEFIHPQFSLLRVVRLEMKKMLRILSNVRPQPFGKNYSYSVEDEYKRAIGALNLLQSNKQTLADSEARQFPESKFTKILEFMSNCGLDINAIESKLSIIHVSGTKGKGSTCAYCESILRHYGYKTGFFSSPHLISVRERIRINGQPLSLQKFTHYFWDIYGKLGAKQTEGNRKMPNYFMFLTMMAFRVFLEEKVDVAIIEVGIGGEYDYTNILRKTPVVGISSLGFDHTSLLGKTLEEIAWQKAGIMKPNCIAITTWDQTPEAMKILRERSIEKKCSLFIAAKLKEFDENIPLGVQGPCQSINASLAIQLANAWLNPQYYKNHHYEEAPIFQLAKEMSQGLITCSWPGRTQIIRYSNKFTFYLDGAHNIESIQYCVKWFNKASPYGSKKALLFNVIGDRNAYAFMECLVQCQFNHAFFCPNTIDLHNDNIYSDFKSMMRNDGEDYENSKRYYNQWLEINGGNSAKLFSSVSEALKYVERNLNEEELHILVTGSLHLVGILLSILDPDLKYKHEQTS